jgi:hypothetical protein
MPGMNEWLTIRSLGRVFCKQLLIGRCDVSHGSSGNSLPDPAAVRRASRNIAVIKFLQQL